MQVLAVASSSCAPGAAPPVSPPRWPLAELAAIKSLAPVMDVAVVPCAEGERNVVVQGRAGTIPRWGHSTAVPGEGPSCGPQRPVPRWLLMLKLAPRRPTCLPKGSDDPWVVASCGTGAAGRLVRMRLAAGLQPYMADGPEVPVRQLGRQETSGSAEASYDLTCRVPAYPSSDHVTVLVGHFARSLQCTYLFRCLSHAGGLPHVRSGAGR